MSLLNEFDEAQSQLKGPGHLSWYDKIQPDLTEEQRDALEQAMRHPKYTAKAIAKVLADWGYDVGHEKVARHRRKLR